MEKKWNEAEKEGYRLIHNEGGRISESLPEVR